MTHLPTDQSKGNPGNEDQCDVSDYFHGELPGQELGLLVSAFEPSSR
ncbi:hypothetical protein RBWH47_03733 [Rhodopirellula baltica WH47]|uniref:Uncharacterized protein n=1 Tax=Rhodopirellula baltica WH47 TaxID=991778 RepID=F2ARH5_RHOBT|nr:hypothetical protein RBWH47_03733 [Rhodopirellula baltica WH47]